MRISDWSSDVCSSDLRPGPSQRAEGRAAPRGSSTCGAARPAHDSIQTRSPLAGDCAIVVHRSEEHTSELQSLMRISYAVFCLKKKKKQCKTIKKKSSHSVDIQLNHLI